MNSLETYFSLMTMNGGAYVFNVASKMGIISCFKHKDSWTAKEISEQLKYQENPVFLVLNTLCALNILDEKNNFYSLTPVAKLMTGNYENLSSDYWDHLPKFITEGAPYKKMDSVSDSENEYKTQVKSLEWMMGPCAQYLANNFEIKEDAKILDVGAGSGVWSFNFLYKNSKAQATLADWPAVLEVARDTASNNKISDRVEYIVGNFHETQLGEKKYDYAILGNVTHIETKEGNIDLFKKIYCALKPGGKLLILDSYSNDKKGMLARNLYKLGLALRTVSGQVYSPETLSSWLTACDYKHTEFMQIDTLPYTMGCVIATK